MIALSIILVIVVYLNENEEKKKFVEYQVNAGTYSPLKSVWMWVTMNILGQVASLVESILIYVFYEGNECYIVEVTTNNILEQSLK